MLKFSISESDLAMALRLSQEQSRPISARGGASAGMETEDDELQKAIPDESR